MMAEWYEGIGAAVRGAGFFMTGVASMGGWERVTVCGKRREAGGYTGNSFWITEIGGAWYAGTWGDRVYRFAEAEKVAAFCVAWLEREAEEIRTEVDTDVRGAFGLVEVEMEAFDKLVRGADDWPGRV